jgi:hypothetical protein
MDNQTLQNGLKTLELDQQLKKKKYISNSKLSKEIVEDKKDFVQKLPFNFKDFYDGLSRGMYMYIYI